MTQRPTPPRVVLRCAAIAVAGLATATQADPVESPGMQAVPIQDAPVQAVPAPSPGAGAMCGERGAVITRLRDQYGETRRGYGLQRETSVVEVFASDATGSWTILLTMPNGVACLVAAGEHWAPITTGTQPAGPHL